MITWTRQDMEDLNELSNRKLDVLIYLAIASVIFFIVFVFVIAPANAEEYDYDVFYDEAYYRQHDEEVLFGAYLPVIRSWSVNWDERIVFVEVDGSLLSGSDTACQLFGFVMLNITANEVVVHITNDGWIPSLHRIIDYNWALKLAYPDGVPY